MESGRLHNSQLSEMANADFEKNPAYATYQQNFSGVDIIDDLACKFNFPAVNVLHEDVLNAASLPYGFNTLHPRNFTVLGILEAHFPVFFDLSSG
jgi:hypothetical protein